MEREHAIALESHEHELRTLKNKTEASLEFLKQEHSMAASKVMCVVGQMIESEKKSWAVIEEVQMRCKYRGQEF